MLLTTGYPVMMFGENTIPLSHRGDPSFGIITTAMKEGLKDLKSIMYGQNGLPLLDKVQYSILVTFLQPSLKTVNETVTALKDPTNKLHPLRNIRGIEDKTFWMEMHVTTAGGHRLANLCMPMGMGEAAAAKKPHADFNTLILGQAMAWLYESSRKNLGITDMRCVIPLAEIRVRDIVSYRNLKLALKTAKIEDIAIRGDNGEDAGRLETITQPILAFCAVCIKLSTTHRRCGGCKIAHYCSAECQKNDWTKLHKNECKVLQQEQKEWNEAVRIKVSS